jgi:hypothetical protein
LIFFTAAFSLEVHPLESYPVLFLLLMAGGSTAASNEKKLVILFIHDLRSYFLPQRVRTTARGQSEEGGYAKLLSAP